MPTIMDILRAHPALCAECLTRRTGSRTDILFHELDRLGIVETEGACVSCEAVTPVYTVH